MRMFFNKTKENVSIRIEFTPRGLVGYTNMASVSLFRDTNMAAVMSRENTLLTGPLRIVTLTDLNLL